MSQKERLNLTVERDFKAKAARIAKTRRRSISALFEDLVEEEWARTERISEAAGRYSKKKSGEGK